MRQLKISNRYTDRENSVDKYFSEVHKFKLLTPEEEEELSTLSVKGDKQAMNKLVSANLRFVISVAKQFQSPGTELIDLIQAGNLGIITAAERFDPTKGFKFISYAVWWIRQNIQKFLQQDKTINLPGNAIGKLSKNRQQIEKQKQDISNGVFNPKEEHQSPLVLAHISKYLSDPISKEGSDTFQDVLSDYTSGFEDRNLMKEDLKKFLLTIISTKLNEKESFIICNKYGINCEAILPEAISEGLHITTERVRQIEIMAIKKLKEHKKILKQFLVLC